MSANFLILFLAGVVGVVLGALMTFSHSFATQYVRHSPKAWIWRKLLGEERAVRAMQSFFGPLGLSVGVGILAVAVWMQVAQ